MDKAWKKRHILKRLFVGILCAVALLGYVFATTSRQDSYVAEAPGTTWARHGQADVNFSAPSAEVTCEEVQGGYSASLHRHSFAKLRRTAEKMLSPPNDQPCVCSPMFGARVRLLSLREEKGRVRHAYNPAIDETWDGPRSRSYVSESQRMLFPGIAEPVENVRRNAVRVVYRDGNCKRQALVARDKHAWCVQQCLDLMEGVTVYGKAPAK